MFEINQQPASASELLEVAHQAEAYINDTSRLRRRRMNNILTDLNFALSDLYLGQHVNVTGLLLVASPDAAKSSPDATETSVRLGSVDGSSAGFVAIDLDEELDKLLPNMSSVELDNAEMLREQAYGRYAICHLVTYLQGNWEPKTLLTTTEVNYRVAGPIASTKLFVERKFDPLLPEERHREVARMLDMLPEAQMRLLNHICTSIAESDNPLDAVIKTARKTRELFTATNTIDRNAIMHTIDQHMKLNLIGKNFRFEGGLPTSLSPVSDTQADFMSFDRELPIYVQVDGIAAAPLYSDVDPEHIELGRERALFIRSTIWDDEGGSSQMLIPAEHLRDYPYAELVRE